MSGRFLVLVCLLLSACGKAPPGKGAAPPKLKLESLLQAPMASLSGWRDLKGQVVVLEFWATWCDPCVEEIPHLNRLVDELAGKVTFISLTDEPKAKVEAFLKEHPMKGWIATDARAAFSVFGVRTRPLSIIVDAKGNVAAKTYPPFLKAADLLEVVAGRPLPSSARASEEPPELAELKRSSDALFEARIASATGAAMSFSSSEASFKGRGMPADWLLAQAYGVNTARIVLEPPVAGHFDVDVTVPEGREERLAPAFRDATLTGLRLSLKRRKRSTDVFVLAALAKKPSLKAVAGKSGKRGFSTGPGRITASGMTIGELAAALEDWLGRPVLDETGLKERYEFELNWDSGKSEALIAALEAQMGIKAVSAKRPIELLVFEGQGRKR